MPDPYLPKAKNKYGGYTRQTGTGGGKASYYEPKAPAYNPPTTPSTQQQNYYANIQAAEQEQREREEAEQRRNEYLQYMAELQQQAAERARVEALRQQQIEQQKYEAYMQQQAEEQSRLEAEAKAKAEERQRFEALDNVGYYNQSAEKYATQPTMPTNLPYGYYLNIGNEHGKGYEKYGVTGDYQPQPNAPGNNGLQNLAMNNYLQLGMQHGLNYEKYGVVGYKRDDPLAQGNIRDPNTKWGVYDPYGLYGKRYGGKFEPYGTGWAEDRKNKLRWFNWNDGRKHEFMEEIYPEVNYTMPEDKGGGGGGLGYPDSPNYGYDGWEYPEYPSGGGWNYPSYEYPEWDSDYVENWFESMLTWKI